MRVHARISFLALLASAIVAFAAPAAAQAAFGVEKFTAVNCRVGFEGCAGEEHGELFGTKYWLPKAPSEAESKVQGFTQAGGRVPFGVTDFKVNTEGEVPLAKPSGGVPVSKARVDVASGLATSPAAVPTCSLEEFGNKEAIPTTGLYTAPACKAATEIGVEKVTLWLGGEFVPGHEDLPIEGKVYNLVQPEGLASYYGAALAFPKVLTEAKGLGATQFYVHSFVKGNVEWGKEAEGTNQGDYHDYFTVQVSTAFPLISSRQILYGTRGEGNFITNATSCPGDNTTFVTLENEAKETNRASFKTPVGLKGCNLAAENPAGEGITGIEQVPFAPSFALASGSTLSDQPNQITTEAAVPNSPKEVSQSQVRAAAITLPEGMTLNPSAARGLEACTPAQARIHSATFGVACPAGSELGTVSLEVPTLPAGSFTGAVYLGGPEAGPITEPPYTMYVVANSKRYGVSVRVKAEVYPNLVTGQLTTVFNENPEQPFTNLTLHFNRGALTPIANPLICGTPTGSAEFAPVTGTPASKSVAFGVPITGCSSTPPAFAPTQSASVSPATGASNSNFTFSLTRPEGQQYVSQIATVLPEGLAGKIPTVPLCPEPQANAGTCPATSQVGAVHVLAGSGEPYPFTGSVFLTGPYHSAPYGLVFEIPVVAGPFSLGTEVVRSKIEVEPYTGRVIVTSPVPTIKAGIPTRMRSLTVEINRPNYIVNPTSCSPLLATESKLTSTLGATASISSPFHLEGCSGLAFKPSFKAKTTAKTSKANGASIETTINQPAGQANIKSVLVQLPKQLPSRLTTLNKACLQAVFESNPFHCPSGSFVGGARANTTLLPGKLQGPAIFVSHGGEAFPDLDLVMEANGVRVILVGKTKITKGITTTNFATAPDAPVSSITVNLPTGPNSALAPNGNLCTSKLVMPTTITAQNGKSIKQNTIISPTGCGVQIVGRKAIGDTAYLTVKTFAAGRISGSGSGLVTVARHLDAASNATQLKVPLSGSGRSRGRPFSLQVRVGFVPKKKGATSVAYTSVTF